MKPPPFVQLFVHEAAPVLKEHFDDSRCLNATRVCMLVMSAFNVRVFPMSVGAVAMNALYRKKVVELRRYPTSAELRTWVAEGAWSLGIDENGSDARTNAWGGHLVAIVQDWLVDASAIQMNRPARGIELPDIVSVPTTPKFLKGKSPLALGGNAGPALVYTPRLEDVSFWEMPGFQPHEDNRFVASTIIDRIAARTGRPRFPCARP